MTNLYKMKKQNKPDISVLIPFFREPEKLARCLQTLGDTLGPDTRCEFLVAIDDDDPQIAAALDACETWRASVFVWSRPPTLGAKLNMLAAEAKGDILWFLSQDYTMVTEGWPAVFREQVKTLPKAIGVLYPKDELHPDHSSFPLITRKMMETVGYFVPRFFPYWFVDTWWDEMGILTGVKQEIAVEVKHQGERGKSHGLIDLKFWAEVFEATRHLRVGDAVKLLRVAHDISPDSVPPQEMILELNARAYHCERRVAHLRSQQFIEAWEGKAASEPSPLYPEVKREAEALVSKIYSARPKRCKVALCVPSGETWRSRTATFLAALTAYSVASGVVTELCVINPEGSMISKSRNDTVESALSQRADYLFWVDSDMKGPPDALVRLLKHDKDIVGATYNKKVEPYETLGKFAGEPPEGNIAGGLHEALLLPGGMLLVKADVYRKIKWPAYFESYAWPGTDGVDSLKNLLSNHFSEVPPKEVLDTIDESPLGEWIRDRFRLGDQGEQFLYWSEDLAFCRKARRHGYKLFCDLGLTHDIVHLGTREVTCIVPGLGDGIAQAAD